MRSMSLFFAVTISMSAFLLVCASCATNAQDGGGAHEAPTPVSAADPPTRPRPADESSDAHVDQVPGALERMKRWPGLGEAVTQVVMNSPKGRIHGHDALRIDITVNDREGTAEVYFVLPASFELHGDRRLACVNKDGRWRCTDET